MSPSYSSKLKAIIWEYIHNETEAAIISRGKRLLREKRVELVEHNLSDHSAMLRVESESQTKKYNVRVLHYSDPVLIRGECDCPDEYRTVCKHQVAAFFFLAENVIFDISLQKNIPRQSAADKLKQNDNPVERELYIENIDLDFIRNLAGRDNARVGTDLVNLDRVRIKSTEEKTVYAQVFHRLSPHKVMIRKNEKGTISSSCDCDNRTYAICEHRYAVFLFVAQRFGTRYLDLLRDWSTEKKRLLAEYGFSLKDPIDELFEFTFDDKMQLVLKPKDPSVQKLSKYNTWSSMEILKLGAVGQQHAFFIQDNAFRKNYVVGLIFDFTIPYFPFFTITPVRGRINKSRIGFAGGLESFSYDDPPKDVMIDEHMTVALQLMQQITEAQLIRFIKAVSNTDPPNILENQEFRNFRFTDEQFGFMRAYLHGHLSRIFDELVLFDHSYIFEDGVKAMATNINKIRISPAKAIPSFRLELHTVFAEVRLLMQIEGAELAEGPFKIMSDLFLIYDNYIHLIRSPEDSLILRHFAKTGSVKVHKSDFKGFMNSFVLPLASKYHVDIPEDLIGGKEAPEPRPAVFLKELHDQFLLVIPAFKYNDQLLEYSEATEFMSEKDGQFHLVQRNQEKEKEFISFIQTLHPDFATQSDGNFYISFEQALANRWFFNLYEKLNEKGAEVFGYKELKRFRYNPNKPKMKVRVGSGIDWFDVQMEVSFGEQSVPLKEIKRAIIKKSNFVMLSDGSFGILPEEWIKKYYMIFRMGSEEKSSVKISKLHMSLIDELHDQIDDEKILRELNEKKEKMRNFDRIDEKEIPEEIRATLRPYQKAGFNWFNFLNEFGWGGCLADDMGLGKTLQALTLIQHIKSTNINKNIHSTHLIICPNSLIFNWENEISKFCPGLTYLIHHGSKRASTNRQFSTKDIILTTYGTARSDIEMFSGTDFHYVILDESQAIKNPDSKITKAVQLLKAKNRLILTGTPVQNNTFDLYAQMNFLNPGILGSMEFFRTEFANPIDKLNDEEKTESLRKLIYPFMLRRTKEQVAPELPERIETVLFCEMGPTQRRIYDDFREKYRLMIMKHIAEEGLAKSGMFVLEGLLKLRQICDSPAIMNEKEVYEPDSAKLDELVREINENVGNHKVLVFSQFLGMLKLIRNALDQAGITYAYLDGQTKNRKEMVEQFQTDPACRVFLISLTAGGIGLNLTAAEYVYVVDPWWNPAVEQQAIDRAHRIGQHKNVFAYKMICKDSVEEKILLLQQKKKQLVKEIVRDESAYIKNLTKDDIEYLFT